MFQIPSGRLLAQSAYVKIIEVELQHLVENSEEKKRIEIMQ
jgi:hypothetical protein